MATVTLTRDEERYQYSIILGGRLGVGKTALFHRILYDSYTEEPRTPTSHYEDGVERGVYTIKMEEETVKVSLWDTGGLERYTAMTANYFRNAHAVILVCSLEEDDSLYVLEDWLAEARRLSSYQTRVVSALWGNKKDSHNISLSDHVITAFSTVHNIPSELVTTVSAQSGDGVKDAFENVIRRVHRQFGVGDQDQRRTLEPLVDPPKNTCSC